MDPIALDVEIPLSCQRGIVRGDKGPSEELLFPHIPTHGPILMTVF